MRIHRNTATPPNTFPSGEGQPAKALTLKIAATKPVRTPKSKTTLLLVRVRTEGFFSHTEQTQSLQNPKGMRGIQYT